MKRTEHIEKFIREWLETFGLNYDDYFFEYDEDDEKVAIPLGFDPDWDNRIIHQSAEMLGVQPADIQMMNDNGVGSWVKKYPFFFDRVALDRAFRLNFKDKNYKLADIKNRLDLLLREYNEAAPGTYHEGATMEHLSVRVDSFVHYDRAREMIIGFVDMVNRARELFFDACCRDLTSDEICEYNILVTGLGIRDRFSPSSSGLLYYSNLRKCREVFRKEAMDDFFDYVILERRKTFAPWRCAEFVENRDLVQMYLDIVPDAKKDMREYAMGIANFRCVFAWSDAEPYNYASNPDDDSYQELGRMLRAYRIQSAFSGLTPTVVYVPKTQSELGHDAGYAAQLKVLAGPAPKGGITLSRQHKDIAVDMEKLIARTTAIRG